MTSTKPRIIKRFGAWIVTKTWVKLPHSGYYWLVSGMGTTPQEAWDKAFPKPW